MLVVPAHVTVTRELGDGETRYVVHDAATGSHYAADERTYRVLEGLRGARPLPSILDDAGVSEDEFKALIGQLVRAGLVHRPGASDAPPPPKPPPESRLVFFRIDLLDIRPVVDAGFGVLRAPFTVPGVLLWAALATAAAFSLIAEPRAFAQALASFTELSWEGVAILAVVIICLKAWHELGHATALRHFAAVEGVDPGPIRAGLAVFAFFPFPYTDATAAWRINNRFRRAAIGLGGIYFESWAAAIAALGWAWIRPGETQTLLLQILTISGFSTLFFNLNPLVRLDGYFVFSDLFGLRNLAGRSSHAAQAAGLRLISKARQPAPRPLLTYWALAFVYRCMIFAGIFWLAYQLDPRLAWVPAAIGAMLLFGRPAWTMAKRARQAGLRPTGLAMLGAGVAGATVLLLLPVSDTVNVDGAIVRYRQAPVQVRESVRLVSFADDGVAQEAVQLESPELELRLAQLKLDRDRITGALRAAGSRDPERARLLTSEARRTQSQLRETETRLAALSAPLPEAAVWRADQARFLGGAWIAPYANLRLGQVAQPTTPHISAFVDQAYSDYGERLRVGDPIRLRPTYRAACETTASVLSFTPVANTEGQSFRLDARFASADPCLGDLPEGAAVVVRLARQDASMFRQMYNAFRRLAQNRLPLDAIR